MEYIEYFLKTWITVVLLFIFGLLAFLGWNLRFFKDFKFFDYVLVLLASIGIVLEITIVDVISSLKLRETISDFYMLFWINFIPLFTTLICLLLLGKWYKSPENLNVMTIMIGSIHISTMMILSSLYIPVQIKLLANMIYLIIPSFAIYHISGNKERKLKILSKHRNLLKKSRNKYNKRA